MRFVGNLFYGGGLGEPRGTLDVQWFSLNQFDGAEFMQWTSMDHFLIHFDLFGSIWFDLLMVFVEFVWRILPLSSPGARTRTASTSGKQCL
jgi:hypothetical protein